MIMDFLSTISRQTRIFSERQLAHLNLGFPEQRIIMFLSANQPTNQECIARQFGIDKGAITKSIAKLEEKGFVTRTVNPDNKREKIITLSRKGSEVIDEMRRVFELWEERMYKGIDPASKAAMLATMETVAANAENLLEEDQAT